MTETSTPTPTAGPGSAGADTLRTLYADWTEIITSTPDLTTRLFRSVFDEWHQATREPEDVTYAEETIGGVPGSGPSRSARTAPGSCSTRTAAGSPSARRRATASSPATSPRRSA